MLKIKTKNRFNNKILSGRFGKMSIMGLGPLLMVVGIILVAGFTHNSSPTKAFAESGQVSNATNTGSSSTNAATDSAEAAMASVAAKAAAAGATTNPSSTSAPKKATNTTTTPKKTTTNTVAAAPVAVAVSRSASLYAYPNSDIAVNATNFAAANPSQAGVMDRLASTPMAVWLTGAGSDPSTANAVVADAAAAGRIPQLVLYNIPERDCGSYSSGGATSPAAYEAWINSVASAIGERPAIVIVEPDALAGMDCLSSGDQQSRLGLINYAVQSLKSRSAASIYIDAGNSTWQSASTMASRLSGAGVAQATGFSLNVSNFNTTASSNAYGDSLSADLGGKHFVVDTSRNGNGPTSDNQWCNPSGRAFGNTPTLSTGQGLIDAYLWIKGPGESDGSCGPSEMGTSAPSAGVWWPQYALMLADNSGW